jgi:hypothetical protein
LVNARHFEADGPAAVGEFAEVFTGPTFAIEVNELGTGRRELHGSGHSAEAFFHFAHRLAGRVQPRVFGFRHRCLPRQFVKEPVDSTDDRYGVDM